MLFDNEHREDLPEQNAMAPESENTAPAEAPAETPAAAPAQPLGSDYFRPTDRGPASGYLFTGRNEPAAPAQPTPAAPQQAQAYSYTAPAYQGQNRNPYSQPSQPYYPQPGYPGTANPYSRTAPAAPAAPAKKEKKGHTGLIVAVILLAFLLVVVGAAWGISSLLGKNRPSTPADVKTSETAKTSDAASESAKTSDKPGTSTNVIYGDKDGFDNKGTIVSEEALSNAATYSTKSVVAITTSAAAYNAFYGNYVVEGAGSGVLWAQKAAEDGTVEGTYIVTNNHVIEGATSITVTLADGLEYQGTLVGTDNQTDVAVVLIPATDLGDSLASIGDSSTLKLAQTVLAIGNPLGELAGTVTSGIISCLEREIDVEGVQMNLMQIDAAVSPGNSGGGLFNLNGQLVGIVNAKSTGEGVEGLGFAIPVNTVKQIAADLIANGYVTGRPQIGIKGYEVSADNYSQLQQESVWNYIKNYYYANNGVILEGFYIMEDGSVAYKDPAKTFEEGDVIAAIDGKKISTTTTIASLLDDYEIGDEVTVTVWRLVPTGSSQFRKNYSIQSFDVVVTLVEATQ